MGIINWLGNWSSVVTYTALFISKNVQYKIMDRSNMTITAIGVPIAEHFLTFMVSQKLGVNDLISVTILIILEIDTCFISGILPS